MSEEIKKEFLKLARRAEDRVAESVLRWRYRKEGGRVPEDTRIRRESEAVVEQANRILSVRGRKAWDELKKACRSSRDGEGEED